MVVDLIDALMVFFLSIALIWLAYPKEKQPWEYAVISLICASIVVAINFTA